MNTPSDFSRELQAARRETDALFHLVGEQDIYVRPLPQRHRLIFYLGHLEAFDWNQVARLGLGEPHLNEKFDRLFERGIDPEPGQLPSDQPSDWPSLEETAAYVESVRERLDSLWPHASAEFRQTAVEHRWMHAETLAYLLHNLPHDQKTRPANGVFLGRRRAIVDQSFVRIPNGCATLGRKRESGFGWDNEFEEHAVDVPAFSIAKYKVTNGDYLAYVEAGNEAPHFWTYQNGDWYYRGMFELEPLPVDAPVYVTQEQSAAFAAWRGASLPTEQQFHRAAYGTPEGNEREFPWGSDPGHAEVHGNYDFRHWDPVSVTEYPGGRSAFGVAQLVGNGWEWTSTVFGPFAGFAPKPNYPGYSADFFDNQHFVLKGASPRTSAALTRRSLRNWFRPDYPYLYATFRLVENE
jgi:formylglycine-generating enzyme required for sulfatase activity